MSEDGERIQRGGWRHWGHASVSAAWEIEDMPARASVQPGRAWESLGHLPRPAMGAAGALASGEQCLQ